MNSVYVDLSWLRMRLLSFVQVCNCCRYGFTYALYVMVMSSAYAVSCSGADGCRMSDVYMLDSVGERTPH